MTGVMDLYFPTIVAIAYVSGMTWGNINGWRGTGFALFTGIICGELRRLGGL